MEVSVVMKEKHVKPWADQIGSFGADTDSVIIDVEHGNPLMYEPFWRATEEKTRVVINGWQNMSYKPQGSNICWYMEPRLSQEIVRLHRLVGNARTDGRHIVVGTGSMQLYQAALYALSPPEAAQPIGVVSTAPYYSVSMLAIFEASAEFLRSRLYQWAGDAHSFKNDATYIEVVCSPNNPDGFFKEAVRRTIHDLAYYLPQYAPITAAATHDIMLFPFSKVTGHAGSRIGWALVKDREVAKKMTRFVDLNALGVSQDSQLRAAQILGAVSDGYELGGGHAGPERFFDHGRRILEERWERLREAVRSCGSFSLPDQFPSAGCSFTGKRMQLLPAFAWMKCEREDAENCAELLRSHNILTRTGKEFGSGPEYARLSMLDKDENFNLLIRRLCSIS
ncbi:hypothetical protein Taro_011757 [Colocasia esculenta]|uniref:Alliinase C-terminal domain-containing protein n=1 Tax=Colocasia esculenta TaxID=4460 RepID=A0A843UB04_COLES|nr:hypothetical protein [Colocasia esculenta]